MKRVLSIVVVMSLIFSVVNFSGLSVYSAPDISAQSAILIDADTGDVLYENNADYRMSMASTTKIMTAILALESGDIDRVYTMTKDMVGIEGSSIYLLEGDEVSLRTLIYGMLLNSGNDAANASAVIVGGSKEAFVEMMNDKARELGMNNTHFCNPEGLENELHYSTARDMAVLGTYAMQNPDFAQISSTKAKTFDYGNPVITHFFSNHNKLLKKYEGTNGVKTGYTKAAGRCLVSSVVRDGVHLICVTLNAPDDWNDHMNLYDYGFSLYKEFNPDTDTSHIKIPVIGGNRELLDVYCDEVTYSKILSKYCDNAERRVSVNKFVYAPVGKGEQVGTIDYIYDEKVIKSIPLLASETVDAQTKGWFSDFVAAFAVSNKYSVTN